MNITKEYLLFPHYQAMTINNMAPKIYQYIRLVNIDGSELPSDMLPDLSDEIELNADERENIRVNRMLDEYLIEPNISDFDITEWNGAMQYGNARRDYNENRNGFILLYNLYKTEVEQYRKDSKLIGGMGIKVNAYCNATDYYRDIRGCRNLMTNGCTEISLSIVNGSVISVKLRNNIGRWKEIPLIKTDIDMPCLQTWTKLYSPKRANLDLATLCLTEWIDPGHKVEGVSKASLNLKPNDELFFTFHELSHNVVGYLEGILENDLSGTPERNLTRRKFYERLDGFYRFIMDCAYFKPSFKSKNTVLEFMVNFLKTEWNGVERKNDYLTMANYVGQSANPTKTVFVVNC